MTAVGNTNKPLLDYSRVTKFAKFSDRALKNVNTFISQLTHLVKSRD
jgi:hypothetical protein